MNTQTNEAIVRDFLTRAFNQGDLSAIEAYNSPNGIDHQEPAGTDIITHLKEVVTALRTAFPDLHFEIHELLADGEMVAIRCTMTGTQTGTLSINPGMHLPPTGRPVSVPHMYFVRIVDGLTTDLWHVWNVPMMMQQLGVTPGPRPPAPQNAVPQVAH